MSFSPSQSRNNPVVFVGTYTEPEGSKSEGVYIYGIDPAFGELRLEAVVQNIINSSFLALHPSSGFLYAVNEVESFAGQEGGGVSAFSVDPVSGGLILLNHQPSHGEDPCYVSVEATGRFALVANYTGGSVAMFPIQPDGRLGAATDVVQHSGSSVHPERQTGAHAHCILPDPSNRFVVAADLGLDKVLVYRMDLERGKLEKHTEVEVRSGAGPRHLTFHPSGKYAYLINELDATLTGYGYDADAGTFEELQTVPTLPDDFKDRNLSADIHVSPDGRFVYASNRGHDSLVCFRIEEHTGRLTYRGHSATGGREPRNFAIDPSGSFLVVANQKSHNLVIFEIDPESGALSRTGHEVKVPMPVCVKFADLRA